MRGSANVSGVEYYKYILIYVDDALCYKNPKDAHLEIDKYFSIKPGSIGPPSLYLGWKVSKVELPNGEYVYALGVMRCILSAIENRKLFNGKGEDIGKKCQVAAPA